MVTVYQCGKQCFNEEVYANFPISLHLTCDEQGLQDRETPFAGNFVAHLMSGTYCTDMFIEIPLGLERGMVDT